ncbi:SDR family oxidoreductase [Paenibacillus polymyxa]|uniref:SDR family oxidoreductase n=1 Tax=Paenibacillus polymyxa TaxID=1406 RepID=UPI0008C04B3C|nr:SDR family oxidoreductase [Paenibacillus polymyxa]AUS29349.1 short-chain dehydrogenase [Paenibacillus polymyxa]UQQ35321.1 SDR family oxidoreductase [Paenibacillus polymyxa]SEJ38629.1 NAD(P)-dependent dehydrogenase, short-chain alcohol dehydrogenase family [Paenibacillus polymyxa]
MTNKIALITGASKGIGLEVARQLGRQGITVLVAARTKTAADEAAAGLLQEGIQAVGVKLEVTNSAHIDELAQFIEDTYGRLDILVNNAGILAEKAGYDGDAFRDTFEVNTFAPYLITEALLPLLLKSEAGRIVNQSSAIGSIQFQLTNERVQRLATPAYAASKAALNMLTAYWAQKNSGTHLKVNSVHPGLVKTQMGGQKAELSVEDGAKTAVRLATLPEDGPTGGFYYMDDQLPW